jgi:hypothetical protein
MGRVLYALLLLSAVAIAQEASQVQMRTIDTIAACLLSGVPPQWKRVDMLVELEAPMAGAGKVQYIVTGADGQRAPFAPCDDQLPVRALLEAREAQPAEHRGWRAARLALEPSGDFRLNFDYPT